MRPPARSRSSCLFYATFQIPNTPVERFVLSLALRRRCNAKALSSDVCLLSFCVFCLSVFWSAKRCLLSFCLLTLSSVFLKPKEDSQMLSSVFLSSEAPKDSYKKLRMLKKIEILNLWGIIVKNFSKLMSDSWSATLNSKPSEKWFFENQKFLKKGVHIRQ